MKYFKFLAQYQIYLLQESIKEHGWRKVLKWLVVGWVLSPACPILELGIYLLMLIKEN